MHSISGFFVSMDVVLSASGHFITYVKEASRILRISSFVLHPSSALSSRLERVLIAAV
jgi:hypothetical protein